MNNFSNVSNLKVPRGINICNFTIKFVSSFFREMIKDIILHYIAKALLYMFPQSVGRSIFDSICKLFSYRAANQTYRAHQDGEIIFSRALNYMTQSAQQAKDKVKAKIAELKQEMSKLEKEVCQIKEQQGKDSKWLPVILHIFPAQSSQSVSITAVKVISKVLLFP